MQLTTTLAARSSTVFVFEFGKTTDPLQHIPVAFASDGDTTACLVSTFSCNGSVFTVETCQERGESNEDFVNRHFAAVRAKIDECC